MVRPWENDGAERIGRSLRPHRSRSSKRRRIMRRIILASLAVAVAVGLALVPLAPAQQGAPPTWKQGQPPSMADSTLAPVAQPPAPAPPNEIPVDKLKVPPGFKASLWAH